MNFFLHWLISVGCMTLALFALVLFGMSMMWLIGVLAHLGIWGLVIGLGVFLGTVSALDQAP